MNKCYSFVIASLSLAAVSCGNGGGEKSVAVNGDCLLVVSKVQPVRLSVYECSDSDTTLLASYPVCVGKEKGQKRKTGDGRTVECDFKHPFSVSFIQNETFIRLSTPEFRGVGIESCGDEKLIAAGRGSDGNILMLERDMSELLEKYASIGTPVVILPEGIDWNN